MRTAVVTGGIDARYDRAAGLHHTASERPNETTLLTHLGEAHGAAGDPDRAARAWRRRWPLSPTSDPDAGRVRAALHAAAGQNG